MSALIEILKSAREKKASDVHMTVGVPPIIRVNGDILSLSRWEALKPGHIRSMMETLVDDHLKSVYERDWGVCFSRSIPELGYFRVTLYKRSGNMEASIRLGIMEIPSFEELGLPPVVENLARKNHGLILITGATGVGKTTTFNAMLDLINRERRGKIITIEDPIEYIHRPVRSLVIQQEVGTDVKDFPHGLHHALRQDPDVIGIGEMREQDTIAAALTAGETGHLVVATLHTSDAISTVNRIVDIFPGEKQQQIRYQLAQTLQGVINQRLFMRMDREDRVLATEVLVATEAARNLIRENKAFQLQSVIATGSAHGMRTMESCVQDLYEKGVIGYDGFQSCSTRARPESERRAV